MSDRYRDSLAEHGLDDVQPLYRRLLVRLKAQDAASYDEAVARYHDEIEAAVEDVEDPVALWVGYGVWLAPRIVPGELMSVDENGRAVRAGSPAPLGPMLMHLPSDRKERGLVLAMPENPSPAQKETADLLCG